MACKTSQAIITALEVCGLWLPIYRGGVDRAFPAHCSCALFVAWKHPKPPAPKPIQIESHRMLTLKQFCILKLLSFSCSTLAISWSGISQMGCLPFDLA